MNANELVDLLETTESTNNKAATMLRQQQAEIEALKAHPVKEHFEDEPQAEELHEIMQSNAELTDEEIHQAIRRGFARDGFLSDGIFLEIKELLRKAQEK